MLFFGSAGTEDACSYPEHRKSQSLAVVTSVTCWEGMLPVDAHGTGSSHPESRSALHVTSKVNRSKIYMPEPRSEAATTLLTSLRPSNLVLPPSAGNGGYSRAPRTK